MGKNLANEVANLGDSRSLAAETPGRPRLFVNQPRTIGLEFRQSCRKTDMAHYVLTIGGKAATAAKTFNVLNPADQTIVAACPEGTPALVDEAVQSARRAFPSWAALPDPERQSRLQAVADLIEKHHTELSELVTREQGKTQSGPGANLEVGGAVAWTRVTAGLSIPEETIQDNKSGRDRPAPQARRSRGVDHPMELAADDRGMAHHAGHPRGLYRGHQAFALHPALDAAPGGAHEPGPAAGVIKSVTGGTEVGSHLANHILESTRSCSQAPSPPARRSWAARRRRLKRITLELGGNDAGIVLPGTQVEPLLEKLFWGCFINAGQTCAALKRLYVHEDQYEEVVAKFADYCRARFRSATDWIPQEPDRAGLQQDAARQGRRSGGRTRAPRRPDRHGRCTSRRRPGISIR